MSNVVIIGGGLSGKHAAEILVTTKGLSVTVIQANSFVEWSLSMPYVLSRPEEHDKYLAPNLDAYKVKGAEYKIGVVTKVDVVKKEVLLRDGSSVPYDALIVATGFDLPLICAEAGCTLAERKAEIQRAGAAVKVAETVVVAGGGPIGLEVAGDIRTANASKKIVLLCRGPILQQWPEKTRETVMQGLKAQRIDVVLGGGSQGVPTEARFESGTFQAADAEIAYDVFIPAYSQGPNTKFLQSTDGLLDSKGRIMVNEFLQSKTWPEIFAVGVSDVDEPNIMPKLEGQWKSTAANVKCLLSNKALGKHSEGAAYMKLPMLLSIGRGPGGWALVDFDNAPMPLRCLCCCGLAGFPCCPAPCCWPCCKPCTCGYCGGPPSGSGPAGCLGKAAAIFPTLHFKGWGQAESAPKQQSM